MFRFRMRMYAIMVAMALAVVGPVKSAATADEIGTQMWVQSKVTIWGASLFQCPAAHCNQGVANPPDVITDYCYIPVATPWGGNWHLVYNHSNGHTGWISGKFLTNAGGPPISPDDCTVEGTWMHTTIDNASLFQCAATNCNQGIAHRSHHVLDFCYIPVGTPWGDLWHLVWNYSNGHVGFISGRFLTGPLQQRRC